MPLDPVRDAAIDVLLRVFERGALLDESLDKTLRRKQPGDRSRRFLTQLVYGTTRHRMLCEHVLRGLCREPLETLPAPVLMVLRLGVFQSLFLNQVTHPAMVHTSVDLAKHRGHAGLGRLANAVLRKAPQSLADITLPDPSQDFLRYCSIRHSFPEWLLRRWQERFGNDQTEQLCMRLNEEAPLGLRVNTLKTNMAKLMAHLERSGVSVRPVPGVPDALQVLEGAVTRTKWFLEGHCTVQDPASMLPAHLVEPRAGEWVLDLCSAPGSKTTQLAALSGGKAHMVAADVSWRRLARVQENAARLGAPALHIVAADGKAPAFDAKFDAVLLDAPCSGLGTIRRHPDLKWRLTEESIPRLAQEQRHLLRSAVTLCKDGGRIIYSVCTFTPEETHNVIEPLLELDRLVPEDGPEFLDKWKSAPGQYQTHPLSEALDGFFLTRLRKQS